MIGMQRMMRIPLPTRLPLTVRWASTEPVRKKSVKKSMLEVPPITFISPGSLYFRSRAGEKSVTGKANNLKDGWATWRALPAEEKAKFEEEAQSLHKQRKAEYAEFISSMTPKQINAENRKRAALRKELRDAGIKPKRKHENLVDARRPARPLTSYLLWLEDVKNSPEYESLSVTERISRLAKVWREELSPDVKEEYIVKATKGSEQHKKLVEEYKALGV